MAISKKLLKHLEESGKKFEPVEHRKVFTAYDAAATMHVKLEKIAKSLLIKTSKPMAGAKKPYCIAVLPANKNNK